MNTNSNIDSKNLGELLKSYYQGKLSSKESQEIEDLKANDAFLADAMEGFDEFPDAIEHIPSYKNRYNRVWISIGALAILSLIVVFMLNSPTPETIPTTLTQVIPQEKEIQEEIIEVTQPETTKKEIVVPVTQIKAKKKKTPATKEEIVIPKRDYFEIPKMELNPIEIKQKTDYTIKKAKTKALLYYDFLAIDYSVIYTNSIPVKQELGGIDASKANKKATNVETGDGSTQRVISYKEQLKNSLYQLKIQNYSTAITNFEIILSHFPQDANAEFYIGYSLFYQENYEQAIPYFEKAMTNGFDFFFEDAEWFKANSLENMGKTVEADNLYRKIKKDGGYYSYQVR